MTCRCSILTKMTKTINSQGNINYFFKKSNNNDNINNISVFEFFD